MVLDALDDICWRSGEHCLAAIDLNGQLISLPIASDQLFRYREPNMNGGSSDREPYAHPRPEQEKIHSQSQEMSLTEQVSTSDAT